MDAQRLAALNASALLYSGEGGNARNMLEQTDTILNWLTEHADEQGLAALNAASLLWSGKGGNAKHMLEQADEILEWI